MSTFTDKLRSQSAARTIAEVIFGVVMLCIIAIEILTWWCVPLALVAGLLTARHKWPRVPLRSYFRTRKAALPATLAAGGFGAQFLLRGALPPSVMGASASTTTMLIGGCVAAAALGVVVAIYEGRIMRDIFDLVPADQQGGLRDFLSGNPTNVGQQADFSRLERNQVAAAIKETVIGQDVIVDDVLAMAFRRAALVRPNKPLAVALFVGATGAGKTELGKTLARELFDGRLVDMPLNQMKSSQDVWGLIGPPPGYMGSDKGGRLCRELGQKGTGVLILDEAEKAHTDVLQVLMRLLDTGELTEQSTGDVYSARGFLIVLTSNAAAKEIAEIARAEADRDQREAKTRQALQRVGWLPEILARLDGIYPFPALDRTAVARVVGLMAQRKAEAAGVEIVQMDYGLLRDLILRQEAGADAGMRNLDRLVERAVQDGLLQVRKNGYTQASIRGRNGKVQVLPSAQTDQAVG